MRPGTNLILAALKDKDIDSRGTGKGEQIREAALMSMLQTMIKQRQESLDMYRKASRADLADREEAETKIIQEFLPQQMSGDDIKSTVDKLIAETGARDGKDMGKASELIKQKLAG